MKVHGAVLCLLISEALSLSLSDSNHNRPPFAFQYNIHDEYHFTKFREQRVGDDAGNIMGEYTVALPDGRTQHVVYHADGAAGIVMEVTYEGEARHPGYHGGHM